MSVSATSDHRSPRVGRVWILLRLALLAGLAWFYVLGATRHAEEVNWFKARGDQSSFLGVAELEYHNWHDDAPAQMLPRNIMPLYPAYLALFYDPELSDDDYFLVAKKWNIRLSLGIVVVLGLVFAWHLPPIVSTNLTLIVAFGYFIFKAGYAQPETLYYFLLFLTFLCFSYLLQERRSTASLMLGALGGVLAALTHLTKADLAPLVGTFAVAYLFGELIRFLAARRSSARSHQGEWLPTVGWRLVALGLLLSCFFLALLPYATTSRRVFGSYFYNASTTYYVWYDSWGEAATDLRAAGVELHPPARLPADLPSFGKYWRQHTVRQMAGRLADGFWNMIERSYQTYWYFKFVVLYVAYASALVAANWKAFVALLRDHAPLALFIALYGVVSLVATAFYNPISATGTTRYIIALLTPFFFTVAYFTTRQPFCQTRWQVAGISMTPAHVDLFISTTLAFDLAFALWPRLMTTYGGF